MSVVRDHDRNFWAPESKPEGVFRVMCYGDSMIFGSGENPEETLPSHLEKILNRSIWGTDVEVINSGVSGESGFNEWARYLHRGHRYDPDLLLVLLCGNDAELFSVTALTSAGEKITYAEHTKNCWEPDGLHFPHFVRLFEDLSEYSRKQSLPVVVGFYEIHDSDIRMDVAQKLAQLCEKNSLDFVDLSQDFVGATSSKQVKGLAVSEVDGHPSGEGHLIAARRLARRIIRLGLIPAQCTSEPELVQYLSKTHLNRLAVGYREDYVAWNYHQLLELKRSSRARMKLSGSDKMSDVDYGARTQDALQARAATVQAQFWGGQYELLREGIEERTALAWNVDRRVRQISLAIMTLKNHLADNSMSLASSISADPSKFHIGLIAEMPVQLEEWLCRINLRRQQLNDCTAALSQASEVFSSPLYYSGFARTRVGLLEAWSELETIAQTLFRYLQDCIQILELGAKGLSQSASSVFAGVVGHCLTLFNEAKYLAKSLGLNHDISASEINDLLATSVVVVARAKAEKMVCLWVQSRPISGSAYYVSDMRNLLRDGKPHVYRFNFPLFTAGRVYLQVAPPGNVQIDHVQAFVGSSDRAQTFSLTQKEDGSLYFDFSDGLRG